MHLHLRLGRRLRTCVAAAVVAAVFISAAPALAQPIPKDIPILGEDNGTWDPQGTTFGDHERVPDEQAFPFASFWSGMFLDVPEPVPNLASDGPESFRARLHAMGRGNDSNTGRLQRYLESDEISDAMSQVWNEGQRRYLIVYLVNHWYRWVPGFGETMRANRARPEAMDNLELANLLWLVIFNKSELREQLQAPFEGDRGGAGAGADLGEPVTKADVDDVVERVKRDALSLTPPQVIPPTSPQELLKEATSEAQDVLRDAPMPSEVAALVNSAFYVPCWRPAGGQEVCDRPHLIVEPTLVDIEPGGVPEALLVVLPTVDVSSVLANLQVGFPDSIGAELTLQRLVPRDLDADVYIRWTPPGSEGVLTAGFGGLYVERQKATALIESIKKAKEGDIGVKVALERSGASADDVDVTYLGGFDPAKSDPTDARVRFEHAPKNFTARVHMVNDAEKLEVDLTRSSATVAPVVTADVVQPRDDGRHVTHAVVQSLPASVKVDVLRTGEDLLVDYVASTTIQSISVNRVDSDRSGRVDRSMFAKVTGVPARWSVNADHGTKTVVTYSSSGPIGTIEGRVFDRAKAIRVGAKLKGFPAGPVTVKVDPAGPSFSYSAPKTIDELTASFAYGTEAALATVGVVPVVHGMALRDGKSGEGKAVKANVYLTGLPTSVSFAPGSFSFTGFKPRLGTLTADVRLDDLVVEPLTGVASVGVPTGLSEGLNLSFGTSSTLLESGGARTFVRFGTNKPLTNLKVEVASGSTRGMLEVPTLPSSVFATFTELEGRTLIDWISAPIPRVSVDFYGNKESESAAMELRGSVDLVQIPGNIELEVGRDPSGNGPVLSYDASANTLDVVVKADGSLRKPDSSLEATLDFAITNLARGTSLSLDAGSLRLRSAEPTSKIAAYVSAKYTYHTEDEGKLSPFGVDWLTLPYEYRVDVGAEVDNLRLELVNVSDVSIKPGIATKIRGKYSDFKFAWDRILVPYDLYGRFALRIDWPSPFGASTITLAKAGLKGTTKLDVDFHRYRGEAAELFDVSPSIWGCDMSLSASMSPGPMMPTTNYVGFKSPDKTRTFYVIPNPEGILPDVVMDMIAFAVIGPSLDLDFDPPC